MYTFKPFFQYSLLKEREFLLLTLKKLQERVRFYQIFCVNGVMK